MLILALPEKGEQLLCDIHGTNGIHTHHLFILADVPASSAWNSSSYLEPTLTCPGMLALSGMGCRQAGKLMRGSCLNAHSN